MPRIGKYDNRIGQDLPNFGISFDYLLTNATNTSATIVWGTRLKSVSAVFGTPSSISTTDVSALVFLGYTTVGATASLQQVTTNGTVQLIAFGFLA